MIKSTGCCFKCHISLPFCLLLILTTTFIIGERQQQPRIGYASNNDTMSKQSTCFETDGTALVMSNKGEEILIMFSKEKLKILSAQQVVEGIKSNDFGNLFLGDDNFKLSKYFPELPSTGIKSFFSFSGKNSSFFNDIFIIDHDSQQIFRYHVDEVKLDLENEKSTTIQVSFLNQSTTKYWHRKIGNLSKLRYAYTIPNSKIVYLGYREYTESLFGNRGQGSMKIILHLSRAQMENPIFTPTSLTDSQEDLMLKSRHILETINEIKEIRFTYDGFACIAKDFLLSSRYYCLKLSSGNVNCASGFGNFIKWLSENLSIRLVAIALIGIILINCFVSFTFIANQLSKFNQF